MPKKNAEALKLPDQLLVRYFRDGELDNIATVEVKGLHVGVVLKFRKGPRIDHWRDLGGGLGFVPDAATD
jgi:hypothetical protein